MSTEAVLSVDIGTSSTKCVLIDLDGRVVGSAARQHAVSRPQPGWAEMDAGVWWTEYRDLASELTGRARELGLTVAALGVSGMGPCALIADLAGVALRPAILYGIDTRAGEQIERLNRELGEDEILARCGSALSSQAVGPKLAWLAEHEPAIAAAPRRLFMPSSWLAYHLTGEYGLDYHSASQCPPLFDIDQRCWYEPWVQHVAPWLELPPLAWPGEPIGRVTQSAAAELGLQPGIPVITGSIDAWLEAISADAHNDGDLMLMYGTTLFLIATSPTQTYVVALQTMVLSEIGEAKDLNIVQNNVNFLLAGRIFKTVGKERELSGWSYGKDGHIEADNSNTQYALLGLLAGRQAGVKIAKDDWEGIERRLIRTQMIDKNDPSSGGWPYRPEQADNPSHTMTCAGLSGLFISSLETNMDKQKLNEQTGVAANCGKYEENAAIAKGMHWLGEHFTFDTSAETHHATLYNVYGIERVGRLSGQRFIGKHDWYREGCEFLCGVKPSELNQRDDGSWKMGNGIDNMPVISTSFALLFLSKGRTPILLSKLAYTGKDNNPLDWNHKHNDARHLVDYASKSLFRKQPLAWQVFDPRLANLETEDKLKEELSNLLQSPILYMTGHAAPNLTPRQIELLRRFVDEGGFIFAEACCGSQAFADGFRKLMGDVFQNESPLAAMRPDHPIWTAHVPLDPKEFDRPNAQIQCIERGCKTVVVFSPQPLAGFWEEGKFMPASNLAAMNRGELAYRFAGNVIAYATGLEMPKPRLTKVELADRSDDKVVSRDMFRLAQIDRQDNDSQPAPQAMRALASYLRTKFQLDVALGKEDVRALNTNLLQYKFTYMHGRREFTLDAGATDNIRANLRTGATLFADACCGSPEFDKSFRAFAGKLYPDKKLERIPLDDFLYSEKLNGKAITTVKCRKGAGNEAAKYEDTAPELEGVKVGNRWAIIYSKYDIGCALEKSKSSACKGYDHESAKVLAAAAFLYSKSR